jgi:hypothetical protein
MLKDANPKDRNHLVQQEIRKKKEEARYVWTVQMGNQGAWTKWDTEQRELTWDQI